jgi:hypothetical protein
MFIQIGKAPDFVMRRGDEILNHRMKIVIIRGDQDIYKEVFTNRSLAMTLHNAESVLERQNFIPRNSKALLEIESATYWSKVSIKANDLVVEFLLYLPDDLTGRQALDIVIRHTTFFRNATSKFIQT